MRNFLSILYGGIKYSGVVLITTTLIASIPIEIIYYFVNSKNSFDGKVGSLPIEWMCVILVIFAVILALPIIIGLGGVSLAIALLQKHSPFKNAGIVIGGIVGTATFLSGVILFLNIYADEELKNWVFIFPIIIWGVLVFSWLGHKMESFYIEQDR